MSTVLTRDEEIERIVDRYQDDWPEIMVMVERHFMVLHNRAQVLLTLCGIVISTTGFSGRLIAGTNATAQWLVIAGIAMVLVSTAVVSHSVLHLRWLTMHRGDDTRQWLAATLAYRDYKTSSYRVALIIMVVGLCLYCGAIAIMLLNPHENQLSAR
jgi:hypothetical protein